MYYTKEEIQTMMIRAGRKCEFDGTNGYYTDSFERTYDRAIDDFVEGFWKAFHDIEEKHNNIREKFKHCELKELKETLEVINT